MANSTDFKLRKALPKKPLLLKDYLLDDLSSCSSNGFKSFPRRQCCTTVRFLLEVDLAKNAQLYKRKALLKSKSKSASSAPRSAFQRASEAVIHAVKQLPFSAGKSPATLSKSFSRKLMKRSFWKRTQHKEIKRLKSFGEEKPKPSDSSPATPTTKSIISTTTESSSSTRNSHSNSKSDSWSDREFTSSNYLHCSSGNSEINSSVNEAESKRLLPEKMEKKVSKSVGVTAGECSTDTSTTSTANCSVESTKKEWLNGEEKEQFSPVSVLDFPCDDEDEVSSPFQHTLLHTKGSKQQKTRRIGSLSHIEPLNLEKRIALSESDLESYSYAPLTIQDTTILDKKEDDDTKTKIKAAEFLKKMKTTMLSSFKFNPDKLLKDFFEETNKFDDSVALNVARDWIKGQPQEQLLGWEIQKNRDAYIRDMEKGGNWRELDEEKNEVVLELEDEVFTDLVNEFFS